MNLLCFPPASEKQPPFDVITGVLLNKLSNIGIPKPSKIDEESSDDESSSGPEFS